MSNKLYVAEFFAGIGLMRLGLEQDGWNVVWANDIDAKKKQMYLGHFTEGATHFHLGDIHAVAPDDIPDVMLATASFPCNDLSLAGARQGLSGQHSGAFWGFISGLEGMGSRRPPLVLLENVAGFLTSHNGNDLRDALLALNELGYLVDVFIVDAALFVPQSRQRLFIVGQKERKNAHAALACETASFYQAQCRPAALADFILWNSDLKWSIRELPPIPRTKVRLIDILEDLPANSVHWWKRDRAEYLLNQMSKKHRKIADEMIRGSAYACGTVFRRVRNGRSMAELRTDGIAGCLRTPRGGSGRQILFVAGKGRFSVRLLTPKECARLMGAGEFKITVPLNQALFGFGDAVCVPVIKWISQNYLRPLGKEFHASKKGKEACATDR